MSSKFLIVWCAVVWAGFGVALAQEEAPEALAPAEEAIQEVPAAGVARLGINLNGLSDWNSELPFFDVFRMSRPWISQQEGAKWGKGPELDVDENGWVKRLDEGCWAESPLCTLPEGGHYPSGLYTVLYEGEGELTATQAASVVTNEPGRMILNVDSRKGGFWLQLRKTNPENYIRNIRVLMPDGEDYDFSQPPWRPEFLERWKGFACLRFMDWMDTNRSKLIDWADRPKPLGATASHGVPLEWCCDLANRLHSDPWFCVPHQASDDFVRRMAGFLRDHVDPELNIYIEYSNEVWNQQFDQHHYAAQQGQALGLADKPWEAAWLYNGYRSRQIFELFEEVFGGRERLVRVVASQAANVYVAKQMVKGGNVAEHMDALAIAPYIAMNVRAEEADEVAALGVDGIMDRMEQEALPRSMAYIDQNMELANSLKVKLVAYEGGQHMVGVLGGENNTKLTEMFNQANRTRRMGQIYTRYLDHWAEQGGDLHCLFSSVGMWSKWGSWGLAEFAAENPNDIPKYKAALDWARAHGQDVITPP